MRVFLFLSLAIASVAPHYALAQTASTAPGGFTFGAPKQVADANGFRLYGSTAKPARIESPQLTVVAPTIVFDVVNKKVTQVRALGGVSLKVALSSTTPNAPVTNIESTSQEATLTVGTRTLVLTKNLKGFYQVGNGPKNTLSGDSATITNQAEGVLADIRGGQGGVSVTVPAESLGRPDALGMVTVTAQNAKINQKTGLASFVGNAHAVGTGPNAFEVSADEFILSRNAADNTISTLTTKGRTLVKLDVPPGTAPVTSVTSDNKGLASVGRPTHVEVSADSAVIERSTSTATFNGNVKGFYRLQPATGGPQNYNFTGDQAVLRYDATKGNAQNPLNVEISNAQIEAPNFDLGL